MSDELQCPRLGPTRHLKESEKRLVQGLLEKSGARIMLPVELDDLKVQEMPDGGMGSLYFVSATRSQRERTFGARLSEVQFNDADGAVVIASLNVDKEGELFELDVWRTDFKPVIRLDPA